jgi:hypothetical protein
MRTEWKLFSVISAFLFAATIVYALWTNSAAPGNIDWVGTVALSLSFLLTAMCGGFFWFVSRRIEPRPEDRSDGEIADGAGEIGFFSPGSYWPFAIALAATIAGLGLVFWQVWLLAIGLVSVITAACGLIFEYYTGTRRTAEH